MPTLNYYNETTSSWEPAIVGGMGATGATGLVGATGFFANTLTANLDANTYSISNIGDLSVQGISNLNDISNVKIDGGAPIDVLVTLDGVGNLAWGTLLFETAPGNIGEVPFNGGPTPNSGGANVLAASNGLTFDSGANLLTVENIAVNTEIYGNIVRTNQTDYANLPAAIIGAGARSFITDANLTPVGNFGATVSGGGSNSTPVYSDGTNWRIG